MFDLESERVLAALGGTVPPGRDCFTAIETAAYDTTGLSWRTIVMYGPSIGVAAVLDVIEHDRHEPYVAAGLDRERAVWWATTGVSPDEAVHRAAAGEHPHEVHDRTGRRYRRVRPSRLQP